MSQKESIRCPIARGAIHFPGQLAVVTEKGDVSYRELDAAIEAQVARFKDGKSQIIAFQSWNTIGLVASFFAAWRLGRIAFPLSPKMPSQRVQSILRETGATLLSATFDENLKLPQVKQPVDSKGSHPNLSLPVFKLDKPATAMLTSGSSGEPSIVVHSIGNHVASANAVQERLKIAENDQWLLNLPCFHVGGMAILWRCFLHGASVRLGPKETSLSDLLRTNPPTLLSLVPTQLQDLVAAGARCPSRVRDVVIGGAPISARLIQAALELGYPIRTSYGLTETSSMVCLSDRLADPQAAVHAGKPLAGVTLEIDSSGHVLIRSKSVCFGFMNQDKINPYSSTAFRTPDLGKITTDGCVQIVGRADRVIISGGENVSLNEIQNALYTIENIESCVLVAIEHERYGQRPVAFVSWRGEGMEEEEVKEHLSSVLPSFSIPDRILTMPKPEPGALKVSSAQLLLLAQSSLAQSDLENPNL